MLSAFILNYIFLTACLMMFCIEHKKLCVLHQGGELKNKTFCML